MLFNWKCSKCSDLLWKLKWQPSGNVNEIHLHVFGTYNSLPSPLLIEAKIIVLSCIQDVFITDLASELDVALKTTCFSIIIQKIFWLSSQGHSSWNLQIIDFFFYFLWLLTKHISHLLLPCLLLRDISFSCIFLQSFLQAIFKFLSVEGIKRLMTIFAPLVFCLSIDFCRLHDATNTCSCWKITTECFFL